LGKRSRVTCIPKKKPTKTRLLNPNPERKEENVETWEECWGGNRKKAANRKRELQKGGQWGNRRGHKGKEKMKGLSKGSKTLETTITGQAGGGNGSGK